MSAVSSTRILLEPFYHPLVFSSTQLFWSFTDGKNAINGNQALSFSERKQQNKNISLFSPIAWVLSSKSFEDPLFQADLIFLLFLYVGDQGHHRDTLVGILSICRSQEQWCGLENVTRTNMDKGCMQIIESTILNVLSLIVFVFFYLNLSSSDVWLETIGSW